MKPTKHHQTLPSLCMLLKAIRRWYWLGLACKTTSQQGSNRHDNAFQIFRQYLWCLWGPQDGNLIELSRCIYHWWFFRLWKWFWLQVLDDGNEHCLLLNSMTHLPLTYYTDAPLQSGAMSRTTLSSLHWSWSLQHSQRGWGKRTLGVSLRADVLQRHGQKGEI